MAQSDATVRVQVLGGGWEAFGIDRARGVWPENIQYAHDKWGPASASFDLRRDPGALWPDLVSASQIEIEIGGVLVWSGRVKETPMRDGTEQSVNVQCEGWQYHLDDDVYEKMYVHTRLADWRDTRTFLDADLAGSWPATPQISGGGGEIVLGWAKGVTLEAQRAVGVTLDLGPVSRAKRAVVQVESYNMFTNFTLYCRGSHGMAGAHAGAAGYEDAIAQVFPGTGTYSGTFPTSEFRYINIFLYFNPVTSATAATDHILKIKQALVFASASYESGGASILKADTIVKDARNQATILLSSDDSQIEADTFNIPEFSTGGLKTPREAINAVNAYEDKICQVDVNKRLVYKQRPVHPDFEIGEWSGADFEDSSANSLGDVSNKVVMEGQGPDGSPLRVIRTAGQQSTAMLEAISSPAPTNPSFDTNTTGWSIVVGTGTITRNTSVFHTTPASGLLTNNGTDWLQGTFTGTFTQGVTYVLTFFARTVSSVLSLWSRFGEPTPGTDAAWTETFMDTTFAQVQMAWTPLTTRSNAVMYVAPTSSIDIYIDSLQLFKSTPTVIDRQGFIRAKVLPLRTAQTQASMGKLGDTWLKSHQKTPFRGGGRATPGGIRRVNGGEVLHPSQLGLYVSQLLRLSHRTDPDTGGHGRDGVIASVGYDHNSQSATFSLDDDRQSYEALMERLAVVHGQFGQ